MEFRVSFKTSPSLAPVPDASLGETSCSVCMLILIHSKFIILIVLGYRMDAISILGREVMQPRGLIGLGYDSIDNCGPEIAEVGPSITLCLMSPYQTKYSLGPQSILLPVQSSNLSPLHSGQRSDRAYHRAYSLHP